MKKEMLDLIRHHLLHRKTGAPVSEKLANKLRDMILAGEIPAGYRMPNTREFAQKLGVGGGTIHASLSHLSRQGLITRRQRTGTVVADVPQNQRKKVGVLFSHPPAIAANNEWGYEDVDEWRYCRVIVEMACEMGYQLVLDSWDHLDPESTDLRKLFLEEEGVVGVLLFNLPCVWVERVRQLADARSGVVVVNARLEHPNVSYVVCDCLAGARQVVGALRQMGHRNVCLYTIGMDESVYCGHVYEAACAALAEVGLEPGTPISSLDELETALGSEDRPTVVWMAGALEIADHLKALSLVKRMGLRIPTDVLPIRHSTTRTSVENVDLWRVEGCAAELARHGVRLLLDNVPAPTRVVMPVRVVEGPSLGPVDGRRSAEGRTGNPSRVFAQE